MWIKLLLLLLYLSLPLLAPAQQDEPPAASPEPTPALPSAPSDTAPVPGLPSPLGAGAGVGPPPASTRPSLPPKPPASADASAVLPTTGNDAAASGDNGTTALFGGAGGGPAVVPTLTRRVPYSLSIGVSGAYDDNPGLSGSHSGGDFYFSISPSFVFGLDNLVSARGNFLHFTYSPVFTFYAGNSEYDSIQHLIGLAAQYQFGRFAVSARESVQILDGTDTAQTTAGPGAILLPGQTAGGTPVYTTGTINQANVDVSARSRLNIYDTSVSVGFGYSDKLSLSGGLNYDIAAYSSLISSQNLGGSISADYIYDSKTVVGVGLSSGRDFVDHQTPSQDSVQFNLRSSYKYSDKLSFAGSVGLEFRLSDALSRVDVTPVFNLSASYLPTQSLSVSLAATRSVQNSAVLAGQDFQSTTLSASLTQLINSRLSAGLTLGYQNANYVAETNSVRADRDENYYSGQLSLNIGLRPDVGLQLFYLRRQNTSSGTDSRSFSNNQAGFSIGYTF